MNRGPGKDGWREIGARIVVELGSGQFGNGQASSVQVMPDAANSGLRFVSGPRGDVNAYRISALFETEPELDAVVGAMIRNGFRYIADLHAARVADVFAQSGARLDERRKVIERLRDCAQVRLVS